MDNLAAFIEGDLFFPVLCVVLVILVIVFIVVLVSGIIEDNRRKKRKVIYDQESEIKFFKDEHVESNKIPTSETQNLEDNGLSKPENMEFENGEKNIEEAPVAPVEATPSIQEVVKREIPELEDNIFKDRQEEHVVSDNTRDDIYENIDKINGKDIADITIDDLTDDVLAVEDDVIAAANAYIASVMASKK